MKPKVEFMLKTIGVGLIIVGCVIPIGVWYVWVPCLFVGVWMVYQ